MILPSILGESFGSVKNLLETLEQEKIKAIHFDVMDNHFVPNLTFGSKFIKDLRDDSNLIFDVHLMIDNPLKTAPDFIDAGANILTAHIEAFSNQEEVIEMLDLCHQNQVQFGLSLKPNTPISTITPFLDRLDIVLIMTVEPGFAGQSFIEPMLNKVEELNLLAIKNSHSFIIEVDGGINRSYIPLLLEKGARYFVMGTAFFKEPSVALFLKDYQEMRTHALEQIQLREDTL